MHRFFTKGIALVALVGALTAFSSAKAEAAFFVGEINYNGEFEADNEDLTQATMVDLAFGPTSPQVTNLSTTGSFIPMRNQLLTFHDTPILLDGSGLPYTPLWSFAGTGFSFDLTSFAITEQTDNSLVLTGAGVFKDSTVGGLEDTAGTWIMTLNNQNEVTGSFSTSQAVITPEPASLVLLGLGLAGVAALRRRKAQA